MFKVSAKSEGLIWGTYKKFVKLAWNDSTTIYIQCIIICILEVLVIFIVSVFGHLSHMYFNLVAVRLWSDFC